VLYLNFHGTQTKRNVKSDIGQALGIRDGAFRDAAEITKMFQKECAGKKPAIEVRLVGHSMGGALAQYAGLKLGNGIKVTCVNSAGLHPLLLEKLGAEAINGSNITHFNTSNDWLSQGLESKLFPLPTVQVGTRYVVPNSGNPHAQNGESWISAAHSPEPIKRLFDKLIPEDTNQPVTRARR
jgi:pimeloyl-ACP methyl ester carboxylesterase